MFRFIQLFTEMRVVGKPTNEYNIVAAKDKIWVFPDFEVGDGKSQEKITDILNVLGIEKESDVYHNFYDLGSDLSEERRDILVGQINGDELEMSGAFETFDPQSSTLLKKVFAQLNLKTLKMNLDNGEESFYWDFQVEDSIPDMAYHGTYSDYLKDIIRLGVRPNMRDSNWGKIKHTGKIFFSTKFKTAAFHASQAVGSDKGYPVIIKFMIPDKDRIIPDYDMETEANPNKTTHRHYDNITSELGVDFDMQADWSSDRLSKEMGIYGYKGAIMPKFIKEIYVLTEDAHDISYNPSDYHNFDMDYIQKRFKEYGELVDDLFEGDIVELLMADEWDLDQFYREDEDE